MDNNDVVAINTPRMHTMQVTVSALRIGTKQVTQSVFRQLPRMPVWHPHTGALQGTLWGTVNYFWNDCGPSASPHLHVVWQGGERLFRDCVYFPGNHIPPGVVEATNAAYAQEERTFDAALYVCALTLWQNGWKLTPWKKTGTWFVQWPCGVKTTLNIASPRRTGEELRKICEKIYRMRTPDVLADKKYIRETCQQTIRPQGGDWYQWGDGEDKEWYRSRLETPEEWEARKRVEFTETFAGLELVLSKEAATWELTHVPRSSDEAKRTLNPIPQAWLNAVAQKEQRTEQFLHTYMQCEALPQLFIAV